MFSSGKVWSLVTLYEDGDKEYVGPQGVCVNVDLPQVAQ